MTQEKEKNFIDPATASSISIFVFKSVAQAIIGWMGLEFFKKIVKKDEQSIEEISKK